MSTSNPPLSQLGSNKPDARIRLRETFFPLSPSTHPTGWETLWTDNFLPWDKGTPSPALIDLLATRSDFLGGALNSSSTSTTPTKSTTSKPRRKKALVPGCGKGYDVLLLSACGYDAYGLEGAPTALKEARAFEKGVVERLEKGEEVGVYETRDEKVGRGEVKWLEGDFFARDWETDVFGEGKEDGGGFDLIYDYTFLCALHPSMRPTWSLRQNTLLSRTGHLICLEFPTYKHPNLGGPPWALPPKVYECILPRPGREMVYDEEGHICVDKCGDELQEGLVRIEHFQPSRTHPIGMDEEGKVTDWIGIWRHREQV